MVDNTLLSFVKTSLSKGYSESEIRDSLIDSNWDREDIFGVFEEIKKDKQNLKLPPLKAPQPQTSHKNPLNMDIKTLNASQILLFLGGLITVIAGIIYIALNWSQWNAVGRIIAIALPMLTMYGIGVNLHLGKKYQQQAIYFITAGSLIWPLFLYIFFKELNLFDKSTDLRGFIISLITLIAYIITALLITSPIWSLLGSVTGIFVWYFFLNFTKIDIFGTNTLPWMFLILGGIYMILGLFYDLIKKESYSLAPFVLGIILSLASFVVLIFSHPLESVASWYLLVPAICYFSLGIYLEMSYSLQKTVVVYFTGLLMFFVISLKLALGGQLLSIVGLNPNVVEKSWPFVFLGIFYLIISYCFEKIKNNFPVLSQFWVFFELVGTLSFLSGLFHLGLNGKKPIYETLLLLSSLGFIFTSIFKQSKPFLYLGTLFLVIYIFDIGGEYFYNQVGWPITLFVAGILSMLIGLGIEKIRRNYFLKTSQDK